MSSRGVHSLRSRLCHVERLLWNALIRVYALSLFSCQWTILLGISEGTYSDVGHDRREDPDASTVIIVAWQRHRASLHRSLREVRDIAGPVHLRCPVISWLLSVAYNP